MKKNIPEIDDLLDGINDPDIILKPKTSDEGAVENIVTENAPAPMIETATAAEEEKPDAPDATLSDKCWDDFLGHLEASGGATDKDDRLVCKLDRDLADSLDDCDIGNRCRSDLVNAIIRAFFGAYLHKLVKFRREKKSLFESYNTAQDEENNLD